MGETASKQQSQQSIRGGLQAESDGPLGEMDRLGTVPLSRARSSIRVIRVFRDIRGIIPADSADNADYADSCRL